VRLNLKYKIFLYQSISIDNNLKVLFFYFGTYLISIIFVIKNFDFYKKIILCRLDEKPDHKIENNLISDL